MKKYLEIEYLLQDKIGYFPELEEQLIHGFSWGKESQNMDYSKGEISTVKQNIKLFFHDLNIGNLFDSFNLKVEHKDKIVFIDNRYKLNFKPTPLGNSLECDCAFTNCQDVILTVKPADCTTAIIYAKSKNEGNITGLIHTGRRGVEAGLPKKSIGFLKNDLQIDFDTLKIAIVPHLFQIHRKFKNMIDLNMDLWKKYTIYKEENYFPGETEFALDQYLQAGVPNKSLILYDVDTYESAKNGATFSYKYHLDCSEDGKVVRDGRFIVATRLRK